jgi:hypothetical protein
MMSSPPLALYDDLHQIRRNAKLGVEDWAKTRGVPL